MIKLEQLTLNNMIAYNIGNYRYKLFYSKNLKKLIRKHISEQIQVRINSMNKDCYDKGACIICGCSTTALQMANKACDGNCYPKMLNKVEWKKLKKKGSYYSCGRLWYLRGDKFISIAL